MNLREIAKKNINRPHLVVLGAGATMAAIPNGDKEGRKSTTMLGFTKVLQLESLLKKVKLITDSDNFEDIFSELYVRSECESIRKELEMMVFEYFNQLTLPETPTIYDYLILSLQSKDCIATFNWDGLLVQAYERVSKLTDNLPQLIFLHGNVRARYCKVCHTTTIDSTGACPHCSSKTDYVQLLFPIKNKNYTSIESINHEWHIFFDYLSKCAYLTFFGYSAPKSDSEAVKAILYGFSQRNRMFDNVEIIDIKHIDEVNSTWHDFFTPTRDHYHITSNFFDSSLAKSPRRTVEYLTKNDMLGIWDGSKVKIEIDDSFDILKNKLLLLNQEFVI